MKDSYREFCDFREMYDNALRTGKVNPPVYVPDWNCQNNVNIETLEQIRKLRSIDDRIATLERLHIKYKFVADHNITISRKGDFTYFSISRSIIVTLKK